MPELQQRETEEPWVGPWRAFLGMETDDDWPDHIPPNVDCFAGGFAAGVAAAAAEYDVWRDAMLQEFARLRAALEVIRRLRNAEEISDAKALTRIGQVVSASLEGAGDA